MEKLPWIKFWVADWVRDTRCLSASTRGVWISMLCAIWPTGTRTMPIEAWCRELGVSCAECEQAVTELCERCVTDVSTAVTGEVTVSSRRMLREASVREHTRIRVDRHREAMRVTRDVTLEKRVETRLCHGTEAKKLEAKKLEAEKKEKKKSALRAGDEVDSNWLEGLKTNPAYLHVNWEVEFGKMDGWFGLKKNRNRKRTRSFILNWINKIEAPVTLQGVSATTGLPLPKAFRKLETYVGDREPMPDDVRALLHRVGKGKGM